MPTCQQGQLPFTTTNWGGAQITGGTAQEVCDNLANAHRTLTGSTWVCTSIESPYLWLGQAPPQKADAWIFQQVCDPAPVGPNPDPNSVQIEAVNGYVTLTYAVGTQTVIVEPPVLTEERMQDLAEGALLLMFALLVIYCSRALLDLLRADSIKD